MTFTIRIRGAGGLVVADYRCPVHGVFEATVQRDENGDPPSHQSCPEDAYADKVGEACDEWKCGRASAWTPSAPRPLVDSKPCFAAVRGGDIRDNEKRPPNQLDTRKLADGRQTYTQWKAEQRENTRRRRHEQLVKAGIVPRKVTVG